MSGLVLEGGSVGDSSEGTRAFVWAVLFGAVTGERGDLTALIGDLTALVGDFERGLFSGLGDRTLDEASATSSNARLLG